MLVKFINILNVSNVHRFVMLERLCCGLPGVGGHEGPAGHTGAQRVPLHASQATGWWPARRGRGFWHRARATFRRQALIYYTSSLHPPACAGPAISHEIVYGWPLNLSNLFFSPPITSGLPEPRTDHCTLQMLHRWRYWWHIIFHQLKQLDMKKQGALPERLTVSLSGRFYSYITGTCVR